MTAFLSVRGMRRVSVIRPVVRRVSSVPAWVVELAGLLVIGAAGGVFFFAAWMLSEVLP